VVRGSWACRLEVTVTPGVDLDMEVSTGYMNISMNEHLTVLVIILPFCGLCDSFPRRCL
jgi:hypothetical protein